MWPLKIIASLVFWVLLPYSQAQTSNPARTPLVQNQLASKRVARTVVAGKDWSIAASPSRAVPATPQSDIDDFVMRYLGVSSKEASVCDAIFADLAHTGSYQLVATLDYSGRRFCNGILVVQKDTSGYRAATLGAWWADGGKLVGDPAGDGRNELLIPQLLSDYEGAQSCLAGWTQVLELRDGMILDVSSQFPKYYQARLHELRVQISASSENAVCRQMEADKIDRVLGINPHAGFARAQQWMKSGDPSLKKKAVCVFADIADQASLKALRKATLDTDSLVADEAKLALTQNRPK